MSWDPIGIIGGSGRNSRSINGSLSLLSSARGLSLGLGGLPLLREVGCNPNGVEEVCDTTEASEEEEIEEDTRFQRLVLAQTAQSVNAYI